MPIITHKATISFSIITKENKYFICDRIRAGLKSYLDENLHHWVNDESGEPLYFISVVAGEESAHS